MSILITGNKGFIASGLGLEADGVDEKDLVDIVKYRPEKNYDVVIHAAAKISVVESQKDPLEYIRTNVIGTMNLLARCPDAHFVYLSTAGIYGEGEHTVDSPVRPSSVYAATKYAGEVAVRSFAKSFTILRLSNVIGPGERGEANVYQVFETAEVLPIYGDGLQTRDFVHVDQVRERIRYCAKTKLQGVYNVASGKSKTILEVAREFGKPMKFFPAREGEIRVFGIKDAFDHPTEP